MLYASARTLIHEVVVSFDLVLHLRSLAGKKVASRKEDLRELVEHFNVSVVPSACLVFFDFQLFVHVLLIIHV